GVNPSQASTIELLTIDSFHDSQSKDEEELALQAEEEIKKVRRAAEEAKAREREKRQLLKIWSQNKLKRPQRNARKLFKA
ncbi:16_t:CDS:2, partial [Funneliformis mosseae]